MTSEDFRVGAAAIFGAGSPTVNWLVELGPVLNTLLVLGQIGVAVVTILYIVRKWRNAKKKKQ